MSATTRLIRKNDQHKLQSKFYKIVNSIAILSLFITVGLLVFTFSGVISKTALVFRAIFSIGLFSLGCYLFLPWLITYEQGEHKKVSLVFMILVGVCALLWIICANLVISLYNSAIANTAVENSALTTLKVLQVSAIISFQILTASLIAGTIIKYKKDFIVFQILMYISNLFFDFYLSGILVCLKIVSGKGIFVAEEIKFLFTKTMLVLFILSIVYMAISSAIMKKIDQKRVKDGELDQYAVVEIEDKKQEKGEVKNTVEERLQKLQNMLDKKIITQEEYDKKREQILSDL